MSGVVYAFDSLLSCVLSLDLQAVRITADYSCASNPLPHRRDAKVLQALQECVHSYRTKKEALIHNDLHTGNLLATRTSTYCIDFGACVFVRLLIPYTASHLRRQVLLSIIVCFCQL